LINDGVKVLVDAGCAYDGEVNIVLITHGHHDHVSCLKGILDKNPDCEVYIHIKDLELLSDNGIEITDNFKALYEGKTTIETGKYKLQVIEVPAHTKGSVAFWDEEHKILFSGDTIFQDAIGRTDFPHSLPDFIENAVAILIGLDFELVLPGHGNPFTPDEMSELQEIAKKVTTKK
jgi:glyoxylase-like metal-dependent hydrolase (beta-lactamase superfamily II)